jgi:hypothetical protein
MGFHIFPCNPAGTTDPETGQVIDKQGHLIRPDRSYKIKWADAATNDVSQVIAWWTADPLANVGIACKQSELLVVDLDEKPDGSGTEQYAKITQKQLGTYYAYLAWETFTVRTGSGGLHLYYRWPPNVQATQRGLDSHVDIRSNGGERGGYVLGAGSETSKGKYQVDIDMPILAVPGWLRALCTEPPKQPAPVRGPFDQPRATGETSGLEDAVRMAPEGDRNGCLHWAACAMAMDGHPLELALQRLGAATALHEKEARDTIRSAYRMKGKL